MKKRLGTFALVALGAVGVVAIAAMAPRDAQGADHGDSPAPSADPGADIAPGQASFRRRRPARPPSCA